MCNGKNVYVLACKRIKESASNAALVLHAVADNRNNRAVFLRFNEVNHVFAQFKLKFCAQNLLNCARIALVDAEADCIF